MKIISSGQPGVEKAALDVAIRYSITYGGWISKGRKASKYKLEEAKSRLQDVTDLNIMNSDGTLILTQGKLTWAQKKVLKFAEHRNKPSFHVDIQETPLIIAISDIHTWVQDNKIQTIHITGSRSDSIESHAKFIISGVVLMGLIDAEPGSAFGDYDLEDYVKELPDAPKTITDAVDRLLNDLDFVDKVHIANLDIKDLDSLHFSLGGYVRNTYRLWSGNDDLVDNCKALAKDYSIDADGCSSVIIHQLWERLRNTHRLRVVK